MALGSIRKIQRASGVRYEVVHDHGISAKTKKRRQESRSFRTKKEAEAYLRTRQVQIDQGDAPDLSKMTMREYLEHWLTTTVRPRVRPSTYAGYERLVRVQIVPRIGEIMLQKLTPIAIQRCYTEMRTAPRADGRAGVLSARSIRYAHTVLKQSLKQAMRWRLVTRNVAADVDPPKAVRPQILSWDADEAQRFLVVADDDRYSPFWRLALSTGMRKGELIGLRWCDVDLTKGTIQVRQQIVAVGGRIIVSEPKTKAGRRTITLPPECVDVLRRHAAARPKQPTPLDPTQRDVDPVLFSHSGKALDQAGLYAHFKLLVAKASVPNITLHGMRHTHATLLLQEGVNIKAVAERLGHASIQITLDTYAHVLPQMEQHAADAISKALQSGQSDGCGFGS